MRKGFSDTTEGTTWCEILLNCIYKSVFIACDHFVHIGPIGIHN